MMSHNHWYDYEYEQHKLDIVVYNDDDDDDGGYKVGSGQGGQRESWSSVGEDEELMWSKYIVWKSQRINTKK